jgi:hypothetical protein
VQALHDPEQRLHNIDNNPRRRCRRRSAALDPGLLVPGLLVPGLLVPGLLVPGLLVPGLR